MRLINVVSLDMHEFDDDDTPEYAILSHTWGAEELTFQQWNNRRSQGLSSKKGFAKIVAACRLSHSEGIGYIWVDTVCINKLINGEELDEAIRLMYSWYHDAKVCYAYLEDYQHIPGPRQLDTLGASRWFTRGWTLQELLAPATVKFFDRNWTIFGTKSELATQLSKITTISENILRSSKEIKRASVAHRMSWLNKRQTTRREDIAYCMIGIFDVALPAMYGEGDRAFTRLQEEVIMRMHDHTIFCWTWPDSIPRPTWMPFLAPHPSAFSQSGRYITDVKRQRENFVGYNLCNHLTIRIQLRVTALSAVRAFALLDVKHQDDKSDHVIAIPLIKVSSQPYCVNRAEPVWRGDYPASLVRLPSSWGSSPRQLLLSRPRKIPIDEDIIPANPLLPLGRWPSAAAPSFAAMLLQRVDIGREPSARLARINEVCCPLLFLVQTRSPRVWHQEFEIRMLKCSLWMHLAVWIPSGGKPEWRVSASPLNLYEPAKTIEKRVEKLRSRVEFRIPGARSKAIACVEFAGKEMEMGGSSLGPASGAIVRPVCLYIRTSR